VYYARLSETGIKEASEQFPVILLTGPRQVGKTTVLQHLCGDDRRYVTLDDLAHRALANEDPALFLQKYPPPILIDEIQYAPSLLPYIKMDVDTKRVPGAYWLTGSQQFVLMQGITESLAGRVAIMNLLGFSGREKVRGDLSPEPFLPTEANLASRSRSPRPTNVRTIFQEIWKGSFPALLVGEVSDKELFFSSYLQTYIERDVRDLAQIGNQASFVRFLKVSAARTGQLLNISELARDVDVSVATAKSWLGILEASYQVLLLPPYHSNITKRLVKAPKLYFLDTGFCSYLTGWSSPETLASGAMAGPIFETWVLGEIVKSWWHRLKLPALYYYRDRDGREIDFLIAQDQYLYPIEAKLGATPRPEWIRTFKTLERFAGERGPGAVICLCQESYALDPLTTAVPAGNL